MNKLTSWNLIICRYTAFLCSKILILPFLLSQVDEDVALDQAVKFCQIQLATSAQRQVNLCNSACSSATFLLHPPFTFSLILVV